jgi:glycosyltransferase involved in cell wall biosynthesis
MNLIFANNYYYIRGGSERVFFEEMELLKSHGHKVIPFSRNYDKNFQSEYSKFFPSNFEYENVPLNKKISAAFKLIYSFESKNKFNDLLNYFKPDIIHAHNIYGRLTTSIIDSAKSKKIPIVMTLHDYKLICPSYLMLLNGAVCELCKGSKFYNCVLTRCHKNSFVASSIYTVETYFNYFLKKYDYIKYFICPSKFALRKHAEGGIPEDKLVHIPNFINVSEFNPNYESGDYILYVGRLSKEKGIFTLLKAVKGIDVRLKIVGDGPIRKDCEEFVSENSIKNVEFLGYKTGNELKEIIRNSNFLIIPSEWYENAPMTIIEAFAYGKPIIGANIGGIPEMIIAGETGLLFQAGDYNELREKIIYLLNNPSLITKMGKMAREKAESEYSEEIHYQRLIEVYKKVLE